MDKNERGDEWLTLADIAQRLKVSDEKVRQLCLSGELRAIQVGKQWRVSESAYAEFIRQQARA